MGFFKKAFQKGVTRDNTFLKSYAIKLNATLRYVEDSPKLTEAVKKLQNDFQYTVATPSKRAKKSERVIAEYFDQLMALLQAPPVDEEKALLIVRNMGAEIDMINSMRG